MIHGQTVVEVLQRHYLTYFNDYVTLGAFADSLGITDKDAQKLVDAGRLAHESIVQRSADTRYEVKYESMGHPDMHNYGVYFEGVQIGYAFTNDAGFAIADTHHTAMIAGLLK